MDSRSSAPSTTEAIELLEQLGDFCRVSALYPPNNARVQRTARAVIEASSAIRGGRNAVKVRLAHDGFTVDSQPVASTRSNVLWFGDCMRETALGGIDLQQSMTLDSLLEFAKMLRDNASPSLRERTFAVMWSEPLEGIVPVERLFILSSAEWNQLPEELRGILDEDSPRGARLREMLESSAPVIDKITSLVEQPDLDCGEMMVGGAVDLLRRILDALPPDLVEDPASCMKVVQRVLDAGAGPLRSVRWLNEDSSAVEFRKMILDVSSRYFARPDGRVEEQTVAPQTPAGPQGHAGDEKVTDDVAMFVAEYEALPEAPNLRLDAETAECADEKLGICLHVLLQIRSEEDARLVEGPMAEALAKISAPDEDLLRLYLDRLRQTSDDAPWLSGFLERTGLLRFVIDCGVLPPKTAATMFPTAFGPYVDAARPDAGGREALLDYLEELDADRVVGARQELLGHEPVLTPERLRKLLDTQSPFALPFAWLGLSAYVVEDAAPVVEYVQKLKLTSPESAALRILEASRLPRKYVTGVCQFEMGHGDETSALARESEALLRAYIDEDNEQVDVRRQVRAIGALDAFWSTRVESFVRELARGTGLLRLRKRAKPIRDAARTLLSTRERRR